MNKYIIAIILILLIIIFIILFLYSHNNIYLIERIYPKNKINNILNSIERKFSKKYPLNDNFFTIKHYPKYLDFFSKFKSYKYYIYIEKNKILGTCCFAKFNNINATYICDLKSLVNGKNLTYYFFKNYFLNNFNFKVFGITMQPNPIINKLKNKYFFKEYDILNLFEIEYTQILQNINIFYNYFGEFNFCYGNKILNIYDKNNNYIENKKIIHIYRLNNKLNKLNELNKNNNIKINLNDKIMFCVPYKHIFNILLKKKNIKPINKMSIIGFGIKIGQDIKNFEFIETYMI